MPVTTHMRRRAGPDDHPIWQLRVRLDGRVHHRMCHGSKRTAEHALAAFAAELEERGPPTMAPTMRFAEYAEAWLTRLLPSLQPASRLAYRLILDRYLLPELGRLRVTGITQAHGLALQHRLLAAGLAPATIEGVLRLGRAILSDSVKLALRSSNPWQGVRQPRPGYQPRPAPQSPDLSRIIGAAPAPLSALFILALATGLRRGELLALRWQDVRFAPGERSGNNAVPGCTLDVNGSLEQLGTIRRKLPKGGLTRHVAVPTAAAEMLLGRYQRARDSAADPDVLASLPVFPGADGRSWLAPRTVSEAARRYLHAAGLADSLHGLRHAHATLLMSRGVNPRAIADRLGHRSISTTFRFYGHVAPRDESATLAVLDGELGS